MSAKAALLNIRHHFAAHLDVARADESPQQTKAAVEFLVDCDTLAKEIGLISDGYPDFSTAVQSEVKRFNDRLRAIGFEHGVAIKVTNDFATPQLLDVKVVSTTPPAVPATPNQKEDQ